MVCIHPKCGNITFYLSGWEGQWLALFDSTLIYAIVFLAVAAFGAGRIIGLDRYVESMDVVARRPWLKYLLG